MTDFLINREWAKFEEPSENNIVHLYYESTYAEFAKVVITSVDGDNLIGSVVDTYYRTNGTHMPMRSENSLSGKVISFTRQMIHHIVQK